jgi:hypothetical protein
LAVPLGYPVVLAQLLQLLLALLLLKPAQHVDSLHGQVPAWQALSVAHGQDELWYGS